MPAAGPVLPMLCLVSGEERAMIGHAARQAIECVGAALGDACSARLDWTDEDAPPSVLILSVWAELATTTSPTTLLADWSDRVARYAGRGFAPIVVPTIYRHVADPALRPRLTERIRQLNMLVVQLSHRHGIEVADVDHAFSLAGAGAVGADHRCVGDTAERMAGHVVATTLLGCDLPLPVSPSVLSRARSLLKSAGNVSSGGDER